MQQSASSDPASGNLVTYSADAAKAANLSYYGLSNKAFVDAIQPVQAARLSLCGWLRPRLDLPKGIEDADSIDKRRSSRHWIR